MIKLKMPKWGKSQPSGAQAWDNRRVTRYIDRRLQGWLIAAVLVFELLLIVVGLVILHDSLHQVVEEQLFRVHPGPQEGIPVLVRHLIAAMGVIVVANIALVIAIEWFWSRYVVKIVSYLHELFDAIRFLDLRHKPEPEADHEVLNRASGWLKAEHHRCARLRQLADELTPDMDPAKAMDLVAQMRQLLPEQPGKKTG